MLTLWIICITLLSLFYIGLPFAFILTTNQESENTIILTPFIGMAIIILLLQNLAYLSLPVKLTWYLPYLLSSLMLISIHVRQNLFKRLYSKTCLKLVLLFIAVFIVHGYGLFYYKVQYYYGRAFYDQLNYVLMAQFLTDLPFNIPLAQLATTPYALKIIGFLHGRIGESILQAFFTSATHTIAKFTFESTILIAPSLIAFAIYLTARSLKLSQRNALIAAFASSIIPAITYTHMESFLSHALCTPLLIIWPLICYKVNTQSNLKNTLIAILIFATAFTIYTEFSPIFLGIILVQLVVNSYRKPFLITNTLKNSLIWLGIITAALLLNIKFIITMFTGPSVYKTTSYLLASSVNLNAVYPWATKIEGLSRLWIGDWVISLPMEQFHIVVILIIIFIVQAYLGYFFAFRKNNCRLLSFSLLSLCCMPLLIAFKLSTHSYQFYKLLLSISPLFVLGNAILFTYYKRFSTNKIKIALLLALALSASATFSITSKNKHLRGNSLINPDLLAIEKKLTSMQGENIILACDDLYLSGWLDYFCRNNHVWVLTAYQKFQIIDKEWWPKKFPSNYYLVTANKLSKRYSHLSRYKTWQQGDFSIFQITNRKSQVPKTLRTS